MNAVTIVLALIILGLFVLAVRRIRKKGTCDCSGCESAGSCPGACKGGEGKH